MKAPKLTIVHQSADTARWIGYAVVAGISIAVASGKIPKDQVGYYTHTALAILAVFGVQVSMPTSGDSAG